MVQYVMQTVKYATQYARCHNHLIENGTLCDGMLQRRFRLNIGSVSI